MEDRLVQLPFWKDLTERERETVQRSAVTRRYEKGALIHDGGSECLGLVLVLSGELRTYLLSDEGREVTLFRPVSYTHLDVYKRQASTPSAPPWWRETPLLPTPTRWCMT